MFKVYFLVFCCSAGNSLLAATWDLNAAGSWNVDGNWTTPAIFPNGADAAAIFGNVITANRTITLGQNITIGSISFDDNNRYTINAAATDFLTFDVSSGDPLIQITNVNGDGDHRILGDMIFSDTVLINHNSTGVFLLSGMISGGGGLTKSGTGTTELDNSINSYTGTTTVNAGVLDYMTAGSILGGNTAEINGGSLTINDSMSVADALDFIVNSGGTLTQGTNDTVRLISLEGAGNVALAVSTGAGSLFEFEGTGSSTTFSGVISGGAASGSTNPTAANRIRKLGASTLTLTGTNTYISRTFINGGVINVQNSNALGGVGATSGVFVEVTGAALEIQNNLSLGKFINLNGTGVSGGGALRSVSGNNTCTDTIQIGWSGGPVAAAAASIGVDAGTLTLSGTLQGANAFTKVGAGSLILSGTGTLTSSTSVSAGQFIVNGTHSSTGGLSVALGALLGGTGTVTATCSISGTLSPGSSIGTLTLVGAQTMQSGSTLAIETSPLAADRVNVTGTFTIQSNSSILVTPQVGVYPQSVTYLIVDTTGGVTGTFDQVLVTLPTFTATAAYIGTDIFLTLNGSSIANLVNGNARAIAECLDVATPSLGSDLSQIISQLRFFSVAQMTNALNQMQPSLLTTLAISQENTTLYASQAILNRLDQITRICPFSDTQPTYPLSLWITPLGGLSYQYRNPDSDPGYHSSTLGVTAGIDYAWNGGIVTGSSLGYSYTNLHWQYHRGQSTLNNGYASLYGGFQSSLVYFLTNAMFGINHYHISRHIIFPTDSLITVDRKAKSSHDGVQGSGHLKTGLLFQRGKIKISPFVGLDYIYLHESSFQEHGAQSLNLYMHKKNSNFLDLAAGIQWAGCFLPGQSHFSPFLGISVVHEERFQGKSYRANLVDSSCTFTVDGFYPNRTFLEVTAGFTLLSPDENHTLSCDYQGKFGRHFQDNALEIRFLCRF